MSDKLSIYIYMKFTALGCEGEEGKGNPSTRVSNGSRPRDQGGHQRPGREAEERIVDRSPNRWSWSLWFTGWSGYSTSMLLHVCSRVGFLVGFKSVCSDVIGVCWVGKSGSEANQDDRDGMV